MALTHLGRKAEAESTLGEALAEDPEDALAHANLGWASLHKSNPDKALEHFREALRLDPTMEWARLGVVEALKARHLVYRVMLRFFLWMGRQTQAAQWAVVLALVVGPNLLASIARKPPPHLKPFVGADQDRRLRLRDPHLDRQPAFQRFLLRFSRFGRLALSERGEDRILLDRRLRGRGVGCAAAMATSRGSIRAFWILMAIFEFPILFPLTVTLHGPETWPPPAARRPWRPSGLFLLNIPLMSIIFLGTASPIRDGEQALNFFRFFLYGTMLSTWLPMVLRSANSMR